MLDEVEAVARAACRAGGVALRERYRDDDHEGDYYVHDVKAAADEAAESRMLPVIRGAFPDHEIYAEEAGELGGDGPYRWVVDPLDGTNNFTAGLPTFATAITVLENDEPQLAVVYLPNTDEMYVARKGRGVEYNGKSVDCQSDLALATSTVAVIVGRNVPENPDLNAAADDIREAVRNRVKRVENSWAPTVHTGLFARGRFQGIVQFHPDPEESDATELFAEESGASIHREENLFIAGSDDEKLEGLKTAVQDAQWSDEWF